MGLPALQATNQGYININIPSKSKQCSFSVEQAINAPLEVVWSIVRQFHNPKAYKLFIRSSSSDGSTNNLGSFCNITHVSGFPATTSIERLDELNDDMHFMVFSLVGGDHSRRLANYKARLSVEQEGATKSEIRTIVRQRYTVDVPQDSNEEDTRLFVDTLVGLNLKSLARIAEQMIP
ncbi:abscisic acid receptor PYL12-like [Amaranthus tricolor]|uniref:abscisic acid receptor PYL12-like n=1 Tax=Amaranthus tricolor TaxID=29722 RepID=UPI00258C2A8F|nr:abscisic acid receptor PYL12-like [Amaranthus tricolor]